VPGGGGRRLRKSPGRSAHAPSCGTAWFAEGEFSLQAGAYPRDQHEQRVPLLQADHPPHNPVCDRNMYWPLPIIRQVNPRGQCRHWDERRIAEDLDEKAGGTSETRGRCASIHAQGRRIVMSPKIRAASSAGSRGRPDR
jgi:hypothetical protein